MPAEPSASIHLSDDDHVENDTSMGPPENGKRSTPLDRLSASTPSGVRKGGPNPNTDYKMHFIRQKERFDAVSKDQLVRKKELSRASLKQLKLADEVEFIVDAIAGERHRRQQAHAASEKSSNQASLPAATPIKKEVTHNDDEGLLALAAEASPQEHRDTITGEVPTSVKRHRNAVDTDEELLESAGVSSKRARNS